MDAELKDLIEASLPELEVPGCAVAVSHAGRTWIDGYGIANVESGAPFSAETRVPMCSATKPYTATALMALVEAGRVELDAPVRRYLPEFRVADAEASERVTVRNVLTHTVGWLGDLDDEDREVFDRGDEAVAREVARMRMLPQITPPGVAWAYANTAYVVAGRIVEAVCAEPYERIAKRVVLDRIGMPQSTFFPELAIAHPIAAGHMTGEDGAPKVIDWPWTVERRMSPAGALISTAVDQLRWARWWADDAPEGAVDLIAPTTRARMIEETVPAGNFCDEMGLGWFVDWMDGTRVISHPGTGYGIQTMVVAVPEAKVAVVVLSNARLGMLLQWRVRDLALDRLAGIRPTQRTPIELPAERLRDFVGAYRQRSLGRADELLRVEPEGEALALVLPANLPDPPLRIVARPCAESELVLFGGPFEGMRADFLRDETGTIYAMRFGGRVSLRDAVAEAR